MADAPQRTGQEPRDSGLAKSLLELAPLELECMNSLWSLGEATVRDIQQQVAVSRPRAYTTIMTIMDRLAHKGVVSRRKSGRAWLYQPSLTAEEARSRAISRLVDGFFEGSSTALATHLFGSQDGVDSRIPSLSTRQARPRAPSEGVAVAPPRPPGPLTSEVSPLSERPGIAVSPTRLEDSLL